MLLQKSFGKSILDESGNLDRYKLSEIIYNDDEKREELNKCALPYIVQEIKNKIVEETEKEAIIIDAPLLFESGLNEICDIIIGVISKEELQIERIAYRDYITKKQAKKRIEAQKSNEFYISNCDEIIENNNDFSSIEELVCDIFEKNNITKRLR